MNELLEKKSFENEWADLINISYINEYNKLRMSVRLSVRKLMSKKNHFRYVEEDRKHFPEWFGIFFIRKKLGKRLRFQFALSLVIESYIGWQNF